MIPHWCINDFFFFVVFHHPNGSTQGVARVQRSNGQVDRFNGYPDCLGVVQRLDSVEDGVDEGEFQFEGVVDGAQEFQG